jgi:hypothetical protein
MQTILDINKGALHKARFALRYKDENQTSNPIGW